MTNKLIVIEAGDFDQLSDDPSKRAVSPAWEPIVTASDEREALWGLVEFLNGEGVAAIDNHEFRVKIREEDGEWHIVQN